MTEQRPGDRGRGTVRDIAAGGDRWVGWYRDEGLAGLSDRSHRPHAHPARTSPEVEAAICELRRAHPRWGQRRIEFELGRHGCPGPARYAKLGGQLPV